MSQLRHIATWTWIAVILVFVQRGSALSIQTELNEGKLGTDDDILFYGSIALLAVSALMLIGVIIVLARVCKVLEKEKKSREPESGMKLGYENNIDSIIFDAHHMVRIPRANTLSMIKNADKAGSSNNNTNFSTFK